MRCPKCSYISYDLIETCVKCGKDISSSATDLQGTIAGAPSPNFLRMGGVDATEAVDETAEVEAEEAIDLGGEDDEMEMDFSIEEEPLGEELDLGEDGDSTDFDMGAEEEVVEDIQEEEAPIGISDLAPPEEDEEMQVQEEVEEEFEVVAEEQFDAGGAVQGLEDLKVDGIDLESTPGVSDSEKVLPSVKTGTALDDFDIDLGDLLTGKKD